MPPLFWNPVPWLFIGALITGWAGVLTFLQQAEDVREMKGWLTGGDSYGYVEPREAENGEIAYFVRFSGRYPLYDVSVRVQQAPGHDLQPVQLFGTLTSNSQWYSVGGLRFEAPPVGSTASLFRRIEIIARNGVTVQTLRLEPSNGRWLTNSALILRSATDLLTPKDFPNERLLGP